jgi:hypothetical protein
VLGLIQRTTCDCVMARTHCVVVRLRSGSDVEDAVWLYRDPVPARFQVTLCPCSAPSGNVGRMRGNSEVPPPSPTFKYVMQLRQYRSQHIRSSYMPFRETCPGGARCNISDTTAPRHEQEPLCLLLHQRIILLSIDEVLSLTSELPATRWYDSSCRQRSPSRNPRRVVLVVRQHRRIALEHMCHQ